MKREKTRRVSKAEWLQTALDSLEEEGVDGIRVERIARRLGISKSGFYWHFKDRDDLRRQIIEYWAHEYTEVVTINPQFAVGTPEERLERIMMMIIEHDLTRYDLEMKTWGKTDPEIARRVRQVFRLRLKFSRDIFREMGFTGDELEVRTRMFIGYHSWERVTFDSESKKALKKFIPAKLALLTRR
ncbi:MAG: TetR/AcrR family transcriptional regulator [Verrucomicrobiales bacterium]